ncbi:MAG: YfiM family protein [Bacteroidia bacterium]|nr:YfiM family protein [Bacteroidia bacterium]
MRALFLVLSYSLVFGSSQIKAQDTLVHKTRLGIVSSSIVAAEIGLLYYLQNVWYKDQKPDGFKFYDDSKGYKQVDKMGHVYGAYMGSYIGYQSLKWAGVNNTKAALIGGSVGFFLQLPIEIWDGMYPGWGFSWSDIGANAVGSALIIGQGLFCEDIPLKYKFSFSPSIYAQQANGYLGSGVNELFYDYNGHTYWLSFGINKWVQTDKIPNWLSLAFGYGAGGMFGEFQNRLTYRGVVIPETERYRKFLVSLDIDFTKIPCKNKTIKKVLNHLFWLKVPFPAVSYNTKGEINFYPLYY